MDRAATGIALGVILFVTVVIGVLIVKGHRASAPRQEAVSSEADQQIKEIHIQEDAKGGSYRWSLDAEQAESFPGTGKTVLRKVTIGVDEPGRRWKVTSDEGDLIQDTTGRRAARQGRAGVERGASSGDDGAALEQRRGTGVDGPAGDHL